MNHSQKFAEPKRQRMLLFSGVIMATFAVLTGMWWITGKKTKAAAASHAEAPSGPERDFFKTRQALGGGSGSRGEEVGSDIHPSPQSSAGTSRQPLQFRAKAVEPAALLAVLASGNQTVGERVQQLQGMRGISLSEEERESARAFLAGKEVPEGMGKDSMHWLADEVLTVLRLQEPPWDGLADELAKVAFQPETDPVVRDYIMQHLGHLWEQSGPRQEIAAALWRAVASSDETTPGTALIALSRGYERDQQEESLAKVRQQALDLAQDPNTTLAVRVTALSIAGDGGGNEVKKLAADLVQNDETPVILRKVAERVVR